MLVAIRLFFFFFNDTATTEIYTLSLHDALPICADVCHGHPAPARQRGPEGRLSPEDRRGRVASPGLRGHRADEDRKSTRLNSSHANISYAVFCLKKKTKLKQSLAHITE